MGATEKDPKKVGEILKDTFGPGGDDDAATPVKAPVKLPRFEGKDVIKASAAIAKTGHGLEANLAIDPVVFKVGQEVEFVGRGIVTEVGHLPVKDVDAFARHHRVDATLIVFVDDGTVGDVLDDRQRAITLAKEAAEGTQRIPGTEDT